MMKCEYTFRASSNHLAIRIEVIYFDEFEEREELALAHSPRHFARVSRVMHQ
jgi:hypothetical protein